MPLTVEDKFAITEVIHRANWGLDAQDPDGYAECFTPDGVIDAPAYQFAGHEQLRQQAAMESPVGHPWQHWTGNVVIEGDGDRATAKGYVLCPDGLRADGSYGVAAFGVIEYSALRVDGQWLFDRVTVERDKLGSTD